MAMSFGRIVRRTIRNAAREAREAIREQQLDEEWRQQRASKRELAVPKKAPEFEYGAIEAQFKNDNLDKQVAELRNILLSAPQFAEPLNFEVMKQQFFPAEFKIGEVIGLPPTPPNRADFTTVIEKPGFIAGVLGGTSRYKAAILQAQAKDQHDFLEAASAYEVQLQQWKARELAATASFQSEETLRKEHIDAHNRAIDKLASQYRAGDPEAVIEYFNKVFERSALPEGFPEDYSVGFDPETRQLLIKPTLPSLAIVPLVEKYTFNKKKNKVRKILRGPTDIELFYENIIAQFCLRLLNEAFSSDSAKIVSSVAINCTADASAPPASIPAQFSSMSLVMTRDEFAKLVLVQINPARWLRSLGVGYGSPDELPLEKFPIEFNIAGQNVTLGGETDSPLTKDSKTIDFSSWIKKP